MIIKCKKCNKSFEIDSNLIPENGRLLQCGSCEYEWFFIKEKKKSKIDDLPKIIKDSSSKILKKEENEEIINEDIFESKIDEINDDEDIELKKDAKSKPIYAYMERVFTKKCFIDSLSELEREIRNI